MNPSIHDAATAKRGPVQRHTSDLIFSLGLAAAIVALTAMVASGQTGVAIGAGNPTAHASAVLDVQSTSQGFLVPRMTTAQRTAISNPAPGLMVFDITTNSPWYHANGIWQQVGTMAAWGLAGNSGTNPNTHFIGTIDNQPLRFRVGNAPVGSLSAGQIAFGHNALQNVQLSAGGTVAIGASALQSLTTGLSNVAVGSHALRENVTGNFSVAIGINAARNAIDGGNSAVGYNALHSLTTGQLNAALGYQALYAMQQGQYNVAVGVSALGDGSGIMNHNVALGAHAARYTNSSENTAVGSYAMEPNSTGFQNVAVGRYSLKNNTTGSYHTSVGRNTGPNGTNYVNTTCIGIDATATASNQVRIGNTFVNSIGGQVGWSTLSDGRFKRDVSENVPGLDFIKHLRPVTYRVDNLALRKAYGIDDSEERSLANEPGSLAISELTTGFIAQEVEAAARAAGFTFSGVDVPKSEGDTYALRYAEFVVPLVKAVQEQQALIEQLQRRIETLEQR